MKILWLPKWYPNRQDRYDGNFVEAHAMAVRPLADIAVLFVHSDTEMEKDFEVEVAEEYGFLVVRVYFKKSKASIPGLSSALVAINYLKAQRIGYKLVREKWGEPDLCHVHVLGRSALLARRLKRKKGTPYMITEHSSRYFPENGTYRGWLRKVFTKMVVRNASIVSTVSHYQQMAMLSHGLQGNYTQVPNVVDTDLFHPNYPLRAAGKKRLIHISTLCRIPKNFHRVLAVIRKLADKRDDFELHVMGWGEEAEEMVAMADDLGLKDKFIFFYGNLNKNKVGEILCGAEALLIFSLFENQPCVMLESFAAGVPVIAPKVGGIPEQVLPERGILIDRADEDQLLEAIETILDKKAGDFDRQEMHHYAVEYFSNESVGRQFVKLYKSILLRNYT